MLDMCAQAHYLTISLHVPPTLPRLRSDSWRQHLAPEVSIELVFGNVASCEVATAKAASYSDSSECQVAIFFSFRLWTFAVLKSTAMIVGTYQITHNSSFCECGVSPFAPEITRNLSKGRHSRPLDLICPRESAAAKLNDLALSFVTKVDGVSIATTIGSSNLRHREALRE